MRVWEENIANAWLPYTNIHNQTYLHLLRHCTLYYLVCTNISWGDWCRSCRHKRRMKYVRIASFSFSGFKSKLASDICRYTGSLVGRDFKVVAQIAPFILLPYVEDKEKTNLAGSFKGSLYSKNFLLIFIWHYMFFRFSKCLIVTRLLPLRCHITGRYVNHSLMQLRKDALRCWRNQRFIYCYICLIICMTLGRQLHTIQRGTFFQNPFVENIYQC